MAGVHDLEESPAGEEGFSFSPLVVLTFLYACGCLLAPYFLLPGSRTFLAALFTLTIAGIGYFYSYQRNHRVIYILFFLLGVVAARFALAEAAAPLADWSGHRAVISGTVAAEPDVRPQETRYLLRVAEARVGDKTFKGGKVLLIVREAKVVFGYGDYLKVRGLVQLPKTPGNPGDFDYAAYLARQGIAVMVYAQGGDVSRLGSKLLNPLAGPALRLKQRLFKALDALFSPENSALVKGIAFGTRAAISPAVNEAFVETGVVHILSVSGLHVGLIVGFFLGLARVLKLRPGTVFLTAIPFLLIYDLMVGFDPPVVRATVMAVLLLWARHLGRERDWPTALALSALVILLANPLAITDPGFQLSFAATWGILFLGPVLVDLLRRLGRRLRLQVKTFLAWAVAVPLGAQLATLPLVAIHYNLVSPVALLANIVAVPLTGIILFLGVTSAVLAVIFLPLGSVLAAPTAFTLDLFLYLVRFFQGLPGAVVYVPAVPWAAAGLWYGLLYLGTFKIAGRRLKPAAPLRSGLGPWAVRLLIFVLVVLAWQGVFRWLEGSEPALRVDFIDVGQGDSALVRTPNGGTLLVDTGGVPGELAGEQAEGAGMRVVRYLRRVGVRRLDVLVLTHPHEDHCGGAWSVIQKMPVRLVVVPPFAAGIDEGYDRLLSFIRQKGVTVATAGAGDSIRLDPAVKLEVLSPFRPLSADPGSFNDESLVLRVSYKEKSVLFASDVQQEGQQRLLRYGKVLKSDVLKVPHHGSAYFLPAFYEKVGPRIAVISVGAANRYGLPSPGTVRELQRLGAQIYRTDRDGAVLLRIYGAKLKTKTGRRSFRPAA